jgi:type I restriction enzyme S subunit
MVMSDVPHGKAIAKCFVVDRDNTYTVNQRICVISPLNIDGKFLFYKLNRHPYYLSFDDGVKQTNLRKNDVLSCPLNIPSTKAEQTAIAAILSDMDAEITALESRLEKTLTLKSGMMHELLTGRIRLI